MRFAGFIISLYFSTGKIAVSLYFALNRKIGFWHILSYFAIFCDILVVFCRFSKVRVLKISEKVGKFTENGAKCVEMCKKMQFLKFQFVKMGDIAQMGLPDRRSQE